MAVGTALAQLAGFLCEAAWPCLVDWLAGWLSGAPFPGCTLLAGLADPGWLAGCLAAGCLGLAGWVGRAWLAIQRSTHGQLNGQLTVNSRSTQRSTQAYFLLFIRICLKRALSEEP